MPFYELRQYKVREGKMAAWLDLMESEIVPFQISKGIVFTASFQGETDSSVYFWIRRFESEADRERIYKDVYESERWTKDLSPRVAECLIREDMVVHRLLPTRLSPLQ